jgi:hypothetical protein
VLCYHRYLGVGVGVSQDERRGKADDACTHDKDVLVVCLRCHDGFGEILERFRLGKEYPKSLAI